MSGKGAILINLFKESIRLYNPNMKKVSKIAEELMECVKTFEENSNCPTCGEDENDESIKRCYQTSWTCDICKVTVTSKNKTQHLRTDKHKNKANELLTKRKKKLKRILKTK